MALSELSSTLGCVPFSLDRIMRFLVHRHFFKEEPTIQGTAANGTAAFEAAYGADLWKYAAANPAFNKLIDDAMACDAGLAVSAIIESCPKVFDGLKTLVDVGGGNGTALGKIVRKGEGLRGMGLCP
ncbi:hypothetical protein DKX38_014600 [Salix brachista]|uniref:O-methyltransferase C-terminal domain-containing protein n=1 Tax=Salix brachista TaxID=2182728 RepID=A0A5N5LI43_9ROSI|nr:hypothetical protein DKX38_014600 [Salix brachista]